MDISTHREHGVAHAVRHVGVGAVGAARGACAAVLQPARVWVCMAHIGTRRGATRARSGRCGAAVAQATPAVLVGARLFSAAGGELPRTHTRARLPCTRARKWGHMPDLGI
jgi:hypothetical protein